MNRELNLNFSQFKEKSKKYNVIPLYTEISADLETPVSAFLKVKTNHHDFLLESVTGSEKWGRYSFIGSNPKKIISAKDQEITITENKKKQTYQTRDILKELQNLMKEFKPAPDDNLPRFFGGAVGFLSYDLIRHIEKMPEDTVDDLNFPDYYFIITDWLLLFDNIQKTIKVLVNVDLSNGSVKENYQKAKDQIDHLINQLAKPIPKKNRQDIPLPIQLKGKYDLKPNYTESEFCKLVNRAKKYIREGDIFQVQVSARYSGKLKCDPFELYRAIRRINPSPYMYYLDFDDWKIVGASPEVLVRVEDQEVVVRPIAGTRRRGKNDQEDLFFEEELKNDPKERAEHVMLVDLGRNDVGRVSQVGSVEVSELEVIERYSHVMHLVSHVKGKLKKGKNVFDVIKATYPAGTLTGAPKIRSMEIIEELEKVRRGLYGGGVGYISFNQNMDFAIAIRTALIHQDKIHVQAAGGIVYDSIPKREYMESNNKARGMITAIKEANIISKELKL
jgi:anthranilate synthase component 1